MTNSELNPIYSVDGVAIKTPAAYVYKLDDVSASDAGQTEDLVMHKKRMGQLVVLELSWRNVSTEEVSEILKAFNPEYINVTYLDALQGKYVTAEFYVGSRSTPMYNAKLGLWSDISFSITERTGA